MNSSYLIYQYPVFGGQYYNSSGVLEYSCSSDRLGEKPYVNAMLYKSLMCMSEFAEIVGDERGKKWAVLAEKVSASFNERLWNDEKNAYLDTYDESYVPQDGNALALLFGLAKGDRAERVKETLCQELWTPYGSAILSEHTTHTRGGNSAISPMMNAYEAQARFESGDADGALELMRRCWGAMIEKGAGTFWEFSPNHPTRRWTIPSHAWSGGCTYLLSACVLGIRPEKHGYEEVRFEPCCKFDSFEGVVVPACKGLVAVKATSDCGIKIYELAIPKGMKIKAVIPADAKLAVREY